MTAGRYGAGFANLRHCGPQVSGRSRAEKRSFDLTRGVADDQRRDAVDLVTLMDRLVRAQLEFGDRDLITLEMLGPLPHTGARTAGGGGEHGDKPGCFRSSKVGPVELLRHVVREIHGRW